MRQLKIVVGASPLSLKAAETRDTYHHSLSALCPAEPIV
jgi:hypothetical protein